MRTAKTSFLVALTCLLTFGCRAPESDAPDEEPAQGEAGTDEEEAAPVPVRTELALVVEARAVAAYTLAINKTTGIRMEQTHQTDLARFVFPPGKSGVARYAFADGRAVELAIQRPHRLDDGPVRFDGCVVRANWDLDGNGYDMASCVDFVNGIFPVIVPVGETRDQGVSLEVTAATVSADATGEGRTAEVIEDGSFATTAWHSDAGAWAFQPASLSVESVVQRRDAR